MKTMKKTRLALLMAFSILFAPTLVTPLHSHAASGITLKEPNLFISKSGKVDVTNSKGKVESKSTLMNGFLKKYRFVIAGISGVGAVTMILFFILNFIKLGAESVNPESRSRILLGLFFSGIAATGLGAVAFITGLFFNAIN